MPLPLLLKSTVKDITINTYQYSYYLNIVYKLVYKKDYQFSDNKYLKTYLLSFESYLIEWVIED